MSKWDKCKKERTYKTVDGVAILHHKEEDYYRDEFKGYRLNFSIGVVDFIDINQPFPVEVMNAMEDGDCVKICYYEGKDNLTVLRIYIIE